MSMPPILRAKYLARFDELIGVGEHLLVTCDMEPKLFDRRNLSSNPANPFADSDRQAILEWQYSARTILGNTLPASHPSRSQVEDRTSFRSDKYGVGSLVSLLRASRTDFELGFFDSILRSVEVALSADYLGQAKALLDEGSSGQHEYVPAAVLAGAVLERGLRTLCDNQTQKIPTVKGNGEPMTMNPLVDELKKAGVFNELKAKQLRSWADIRNAAAHGEWEKFNRQDVEMMLGGSPPSWPKCSE